MKSNVSRKSEIEEHEKNNPNFEASGDQFYDNIGKYCNYDAIKNNLMLPSIDSHEENVNDNSGECEGMIPEEAERH